MRLSRCAWWGGIGLLLPLAAMANLPQSALPPRVLMVGGGPNLAYNQVAIESNVRYVNKLLPKEAPRTTLFADGDANNATVLYEIDPRALPVGERILNLLLKDRDMLEANPTQFKKPNLGCRLDGPTNPTEMNRVFGKLQQEMRQSQGQSLFLYFTGHGSSDQRGDENNVFDMWGDQRFSVRDLSRQIARLPEETPVTLVMVQCHSGSFANLIFDNGDPQAELAKRNIAGFFAATKERFSAGCTSEMNEAEYKDFTSYFFAALTGVDRVGRKVTGADYNRDGRVGMDEAFCYSIAYDRSIDVPVCTSDLFLRRFVPSNDLDLFKARYSQVLTWATPAQRHALQALAKTLKRDTGEDRLLTAYRDMMRQANGEVDSEIDDSEARDRYAKARNAGRRRLFSQWPALRAPDAAGYRTAYNQAKAELAEQAKAGQWRDLLDAEETLSKTESEQERHDIGESHLLRFVRLGKSVILARRLRLSGEEALKSRFERLVQQEGATLLPPLMSLPKGEQETP